MSKGKINDFAEKHQNKLDDFGENDNQAEADSTEMELNWRTTE